MTIFPREGEARLGWHDENEMESWICIGLAVKGRRSDRGKRATGGGTWGRVSRAGELAE